MGFKGLEDLIAAAPDVELPEIIEMPNAGVPSMSSLEIARLTGKRHDHVIRDIETILNEAGIGAPKFGGTYTDSQNKSRPCYILPRRECDLVVSGYSVKYRLAIIDRWQELEAKQAAPAIRAPQTLREALQLALDQQERIEALETTVSEITPKAEALDRIADAEGLLNLTNAAKALQVQPKKFIAYLQTSGWIYRRNGSAEWVPYQGRIQSGHMQAKIYTFTSQTTGDEVLKERAMITAKGLALLAKSFSGRNAA